MARSGMIDEGWSSRCIEVMNKIDLLDPAARDLPGASAIAVSALSGENLDTLRATIDARLAGAMQVATYWLAPADGAGLAWLYRHGEVISRADGEDAIAIEVRLRPEDRARFERDHEAALHAPVP